MGEVQRPTICRMVVYVDADGLHHPAVVTRGADPNDPLIRCRLRVLWDTIEDWFALLTDVPHALPEDNQPNSWHWPPRS